MSQIGFTLLGGYLGEHLGWRWIFFLIVPFCIAAFFMVLAFIFLIMYMVSGLRTGMISVSSHAEIKEVKQQLERRKKRKSRVY